MIRPITPEDSSVVIELAVDSGLFPPDAAGIIVKMMADYFAVTAAEGHVCVIDDDGSPRAMAYYEPAVATDRTWNLTMIAVREEDKARGRGSALMRHVEDELRASGQRLLIVQTSGLPEYERTRAFYDKCGYEQESRVRDYFEDGDDMVVFRKSLSG